MCAARNLTERTTHDHNRRSGPNANIARPARSSFAGRAYVVELLDENDDVVFDEDFSEEVTGGHEDLLAQMRNKAPLNDQLAIHLLTYDNYFKHEQHDGPWRLCASVPAQKTSLRPTPPLASELQRIGAEQIDKLAIYFFDELDSREKQRALDGEVFFRSPSPPRPLLSLSLSCMRGGASIVR